MKIAKTFNHKSFVILLQLCKMCVRHNVCIATCECVCVCVCACECVQYCACVCKYMCMCIMEVLLFVLWYVSARTCL